eukprot:SAG11_NODE_433_length_9518_cov_11.247054_5_plen_557_part_00
MTSQIVTQAVPLQEEERETLLDSGSDGHALEQCHAAAACELQSQGAVVPGARASARPVGLRKALTAVDGVAIVVGVIIGTGIFASPGVVMESCGNVWLGLLAWLIAGCLAAASSLVYCELGAMIPQAGGDYAYLNAAFGPSWAFSWAFTQFAIQKPGSLAIVSLTVGRYATGAVYGVEAGTTASGESSLTVKSFAVVYILAITAINVMPVGLLASGQRLVTATKPALIVALALLAATYAAKVPATLISNFGGGATQAGGELSLSGLGPAIFAALWAFNGWANIANMAEEMEKPQRDLPRAVIAGMATVVAAYLLANLAYLAVMPAFGPGTSLATSPVAAVASATIASVALFSSSTATVVATAVAALIFVSGVGSSNVTVMTGGRYLYAVSRSGEIPRCCSALSRYQTPYAALWAQAAWAILLLCVPGAGLSDLMSYFGVSSWVFFAATAAAMLRLRKIRPDPRTRPYRAPILSPLICIVSSMLLIGSTLFSAPSATIAALGFICCSFPCRFLFVRWRDGGGARTVELSTEIFWNGVPANVSNDGGVSANVSNDGGE